ncbi:MAG: SPASM domain-containing protein [Clostridiales bacterium]|nr:SPASM domain-containing protein [Clostridiales bacterium]
MDCKYCFYKSASEARENRIMTKKTVDELIRKIKAYQPSALSVMFQGGEPTLAGLDYFEYFVQSVKQNLTMPVSFALQTNGLLINNGFAKFFKKNNFLIGVSLDGNRKTNDRYRLDKNGNCVLPKILDACKLLNKHGVDFNILSVIDDKNAADIESTWADFKKHGFDYLQFIPYVDEGNSISLSCGAYAKFLKKSFDLWYEEWEAGHYISVRHIDNYINILMGNPPESCAMCGVCGNYFVVEANGDLFPCDFYCNDEFKLASIFEENPFEINGKHKAFIEKSHIIHESCSSCKYYILCRGGCRRDRTDGYTKNKYCEAYKEFFDYSADRMAMIARRIKDE